MPIVTVLYDAAPMKQLIPLVERLATLLPEVVCTALQSTEFPLGPNDIHVHVSPHRDADRNTKDIEIIVDAHDFPERRANIDERTCIVSEAVRAFLDENKCGAITGFTWIRLMPTGFAAF